MRKWVIEKWIILSIYWFDFFEYFLFFINFKQFNPCIISYKKLYSLSPINPIKQQISFHIFFYQNLSFMTDKMPKQISIKCQEHNDIPEGIIHQLSNGIYFSQICNLCLLFGNNEDTWAIVYKHSIGTGIKKILSKLGHFFLDDLEGCLLFGVG